MPTYHAGNSSPLRTCSPKRSDDNQQAQTYQQRMGSTAGNTYNMTQVNKTSSASYQHSYGQGGGNCAGAPTEKERMIQQLMKEAADLRQRERDYKALQDQLMNLEQNFGRLNEEKRRMDEDYKSRVDANIRFI